MASFAETARSTLPHRSNVLRQYRELVGLIKGLPEREQAEALEKARTRVRANSTEPDPMKASDMLRDLVKQSSFLKTITPKYQGRQGNSSGVFVLREGQLVEGRAIKESRVSDGSLDLNEARAKQKELVRRQHFGNLPGKKEFW